MGNVLTTTTPGHPHGPLVGGGDHRQPAERDLLPVGVALRGRRPVRQRVDLDQPGRRRGRLGQRRRRRDQRAHRRVVRHGVGVRGRRRQRRRLSPTPPAEPARGRARTSTPSRRSTRSRAPRRHCASPSMTPATCSPPPPRAPRRARAGPPPPSIRRPLWTPCRAPPRRRCASPATTAGNVLVSANPAGGAAAWHWPASRTARRLTGCRARAPASARAPMPTATSSSPPTPGRRGGVGVHGARERHRRGLCRRSPVRRPASATPWTPTATCCTRPRRASGRPGGPRPPSTPATG